LSPGQAEVFCKGLVCLTAGLFAFLPFLLAAFGRWQTRREYNLLYFRVSDKYH
jgi:hypothetical protein